MESGLLSTDGGVTPCWSLAALALGASLLPLGRLGEIFVAIRLVSSFGLSWGCAPLGLAKRRCRRRCSVSSLACHSLVRFCGGVRMRLGLGGLVVSCVSLWRSTLLLVWGALHLTLRGPNCLAGRRGFPVRVFRSAAPFVGPVEASDTALTAQGFETRSA